MPLLPTIDELLNDCLVQLQRSRDDARIDALCFDLETTITNRKSAREKDAQYVKPDYIGALERIRNLAYGCSHDQGFCDEAEEHFTIIHDVAAGVCPYSVS